MERRIEVNAMRSDGSELPVELAIMPIHLEGSATVFTATLRDISERKRVEEDLRAQEERYRRLFENATHGIYRTTPDGRILLANPALLAMLGYDNLERLAARNLESDGTEATYARDDFKTQLEAAGELRGLEAEWKRHDGGVISVRENAHLVRDAEGRPLYYEGYVEDITGRKRAEQEIHHLHAELTSAYDRTLDAYDATIEGWSRALDYRDHETEGHSKRVTELTLRLARALGIGEEELVHVRRGALLHDIGKMAVPDSVLLKPGPLDDAEWEVMRRHPSYAQEMLAPVAFLRPALDIPRCHHEKWDGTGYPECLRGEQIPLAARLFAVVDVWDALRSDRPYRKAWDRGRTLDHIRGLSGTHFDPQVVRVFLPLMAEGDDRSGESRPLALAA